MARTRKIPETLVADAQQEAAQAAELAAAQPASSLRLPAELTIYTASETRAAWLAWLGGDEALSGHGEALCAVDASGCDEIDAAGAQLLVALAHSLAQQQRRLQLQDPSHPVRQACADLGLASWLLGRSDQEALA